MKYINIILLCVAVLFSSCEDYLEQQPVDLITNETVVEDLASLEALVLGMYSNMQVDNQYGELHIFMGGILSDEMVFTGTFPTKADMAVNNVTAENVTMRGAFSSPYTGILIANTILERAQNATDATEDQIASRVAEAKFGRAFFLFSLVRFWGGIPMPLSSDLLVTSSLPKSSEAEVYDQIIQDLEEAIPDLPDASVNGVYRATQAAAQGLLARAYLYTGDMTNAALMATNVINNTDYSLDSDYSNLFANSGSSDEVIFKLYASAQDPNSLGFFAQPPSAGGRYDYAPNPTLLAAMDPSDVRANLIVENGPNPGQLVTNKYTDVLNGTDEPIILRLAEMYLIRAEANASLADLNIVAERATGNASFYGSYSLDNLLQERKFELAFEGHRWHDLVRTGTADAVMSAIKPLSWNSTDVLLPIPQRELEQNPNLGPEDQNPGY